MDTSDLTQILFKLKEYLDSINKFTETQIKLIISKVKHLVYIIEQTNDDYDGKRTAMSILKMIYDNELLLKCLADLTFDIEDKYEKLEWCLKGCIVGSKNFVEHFFTDEFNPKKNTWLISFAICSNDTDWVISLVEKWNVNIKLSKYCFLTYSKRLNNQVLIDYFNNKQ